MKIVSLVPSATEILRGLGLTSSIVGVSDSCRLPGKPIVMRGRVGDGTGREIHDRVTGLMDHRDEMYDLDMDFLRREKPDLIFTQDLCHVCSMTSAGLARQLERLVSRPRVVSLSPTRLDHVFRDIVLVGRVTGKAAEARRLVRRLRQRLNRIEAKTKRLKKPRVLFLEWLDPPFVPGHWIPEQIRLAGGEPVVGEDGAKAGEMPAADLRASTHERVALACCGWDVRRTQGEVRRLAQEGRLPYDAARPVYALDDRYFASPGPGLVDGVAILARILHPALRVRTPLRSWARIPTVRLPPARQDQISRAPVVSLKGTSDDSNDAAHPDPLPQAGEGGRRVRPPAESPGEGSFRMRAKGTIPPTTTPSS